MQVSLVGIGMGNTKLITEEAAERIKGADLLFGAKDCWMRCRRNGM